MTFKLQTLLTVRFTIYWVVLKQLVNIVSKDDRVCLPELTQKHPVYLNIFRIFLRKRHRKIIV